MQSTLTPRPNDDPHDVVVVAPDAVRVAPADDELSNLLHQAARYRSDTNARAAADFAAGPAVPPVDTTFRPTALNDVLTPGRGWSMVRRAVRAFMALLLAACIGVAALAWRAYGDAIEKKIARWTTQFVLTASQPPQESASAAQPAEAADQADAANAAPAQQAAPVAADAVTPAAASPDSAQLLQSMARDLANLGQEVGQLKASVEQLKAGQQQMPRDAVRPVEPNLRPKLSALPPRPAIARPRKPALLPPAQAAGAPALPPAAAPYPAPAPYYAQRQPDYAPRQIEPPPQPAAETLGDPELSSVPRPPMPLMR